MYEAYRTLFDKSILALLERLEFLEPMHAIHFFLFKRDNPYSGLFFLFRPLGYYEHPTFFDSFFADPLRSGKFFLGPREDADIAAWTIRYAHNVGGGLAKRIFTDDEMAKRFKQHSSLISSVTPNNPPINKHLSHASPSSEVLIDVICQHDPDTFPWNSEGRRNAVVVRYVLVRSFINLMNARILTV